MQMQTAVAWRFLHMWEFFLGLVGFEFPLGATWHRVAGPFIVGINRRLRLKTEDSPSESESSSHGSLSRESVTEHPRYSNIPMVNKAVRLLLIILFII